MAVPPYSTGSDHRVAGILKQSPEALGPGSGEIRWAIFLGKAIAQRRDRIGFRIVLGPFQLQL